MSHRVLQTALAAAILTTIGGCGGGGGSSAPALAPVQPPAASPTPVTTSGVITGFSSVIVNGVRYAVAGDTVVRIDDDGEFVGDDSRLRVGMRVRIRASRDDGDDPVAERIDYDDDFRGPARDVTASADNPALGSFLVLGQTVLVDGNTVFDDDVGDNNSDGRIDIRDLELAGGSQVVVEVSGLPTADGVLATRIDRVNAAAGVPGIPDDEFEIKGFVDAVAGDGGAFEINGTTFLVVAGAGGTLFEDGLAADDGLVGVFVEVKADENGAGELIAVRVEREDDFGDDRDGEFEIEGILMSVDTDADPDVVVINGLTLQVADAGSLVGREGNRVELEGEFDANGVLVLRQTRLEVENTVRIEDRVAAVNPAAGTVTTRLGVDIVPTGDSRVEDDTASDDEGDHLTAAEFLERVQIDDFIEARGYPNGDGTVTWRRIELEDEDDGYCELRGPVESIDGTDAMAFSFVIQGVTIDVSQISSDDDFEGDDRSLGRQAFFDNLDVGDVVEAESDEFGTGCQDRALSARKVEFEGDDDIVGSVRDDDGDDGASADEIVGTPSDVGSSSFVVAERTIRVVGNTLIDDSIIERALGREFDGDDRRFDQLPEGLTLQDLLSGEFTISVRVGAESVALSIEDI
ncbi:MAG: DUF5666 domain-containing protein [Pseudomonadales bacterium]